MDIIINHQDKITIYFSNNICYENNHRSIYKYLSNTHSLIREKYRPI